MQSISQEQKTAIKEKPTAEQLVHYMAQLIYDQKGFNIIALDVRGISSATDYILIAEGNVHRHLIALADTISEDVKENFSISALHKEGFDLSEWVLLDYTTIMVHLFLPDSRAKYQLEQLWSKGKIVDLPIKLSPS